MRKSASTPGPTGASAGKNGQPSAAFDIVALASSAGGIEALVTVLRALPADFPAAILVLQHMRGPSTLPDVLQRRCALTVAWAVDGAPITPGHVFVCPPMRALEVFPDHTCHIPPDVRGGMQKPIDTCLVSLAESYGERALAVILSGLLNDGAAGVQAIKAAGGTVIVQSEDTAEQPSMPRAALDTGVVDLVLPLSEIGPVLADVVAGGPLPRPRSEIEAVDELFGGPGEMRSLLRSIDWSRTALGPVAAWPVNLRSTVSNLLASRFPMCVYWGPDYIHLYNDAYIPILGLKHPSAAGRPAAQSWAEFWDQVRPRFDTVMRTGEAIYEEDSQLQPNVRGAAEEAYYTFSCSPIQDKRGPVQGLLLTVYETTERVLSERRLHTLRALGAEAAAGTVSEACESAAEALAENPLDIPFALIYQLDRTRLRASLMAAAGLQAGGFAAPRVVELMGERPIWPLAKVVSEATPLVVDDLAGRFRGLTAGPWPDPPTAALLLPLLASPDGKPSGVLIVGLNARRRLDAAYRDFLDLVATRITARIARVQATASNRERLEALAALDRAKIEFFSNVSHEFRTPLTLMLAPLEEALERRDALPEDLRAELDVAARNGRRLLELVNTLLDFSQAEAGRLNAHFEPVDLAAYTTELASLFRSAADRAGLRLVVDCPPLPTEVWVDRDMWEKIVSNLLSNALKFTFQGEIEVRLSTLAQHAELTVRDTGVGIPAEEIPHLFKRFHRVPGTPARTQEGSGIGLALVDQLIRLHHGRVRVTSQVGKGTTFTVWLPLLRRPLGVMADDTPRNVGERAPETAMQMAQTALTWGQNGEDVEVPVDGDRVAIAQDLRVRAAGARILVVDDNRDMRDYLRRLLTSIQWKVETAADGAEALAKIRRRAPDLVLADVIMPNMDGFTLLRAIRETPAIAALPVVLVTARAEEEAAIEGMMAGADDYIAKPFGARELIARVSAQLELARLRHRAAELNAFRVRLSDALRPLSDPRDIKQTSCRMVVEQLGTERCFFAEIDEEAGEFIVEPGYQRPGVPVVSGRFRLAAFEPFATEYQAGRPVIVQDSNIDPRIPDAVKERLRGMRSSSSIGMPIMRSGRFRALLSVNQMAPREWTSEEVALVEEIAGRAWAEVERARAEQALRESEARYRTLFEEMEEGYIQYELVRDVDGRPVDIRILELNRAFTVLSGLPLEGTVGRLRSEVIPAPQADTLDTYVRAIETGEPMRFETYAPGLGRWYDIRVYPRGRECIAVLYDDITERKRAEEALRASEARLAIVFESLPVGVGLLDTQGVLLLANQEMRRFLPTGVMPSRDDARFARWRSYYPDGRRIERTDYPGARALRGETVLPGIEFLCEQDDGGEIWVRVAAVPIRDEEGRITGAITVVTDIDASKRTQEALRESEARFRVLVNASSYVVYRMSPDWSEMRHLDGRGFIADTPNPTRGWLETYIHPDDQPRVLEAIHEAIRTKSNFVLEHRVRRVDGTLGWTLSRAVPILGADGEIIEWFGAASDVTVRKETEEALQALNERLEERVSSRGTAALRQSEER
ncbi:MAG: chemotaxis protein CheB [Anaerolineae bacterium]